jgi:hypothetical protein
VTSDDYPIGIPFEVAEARVAQLAELWGTEASAAVVAPSRAGDQRFRRWYAKLQRTSAGPRAAPALLRALLAVDVRPILPLAQAPTLVLHRRDVQFVPSTAATLPSTSRGQAGRASRGRHGAGLGVPGSCSGPA